MIYFCRLLRTASGNNSEGQVDAKHDSMETTWTSLKYGRCYGDKISCGFTSIFEAEKHLIYPPAPLEPWDRRDMAAHSITNPSVDEESGEQLAGLLIDFFLPAPIQIQHHTIALDALQKLNQLDLCQHCQRAESVEGHSNGERRGRMIRPVILSCIMAFHRLPIS